MTAEAGASRNWDEEYEADSAVLAGDERARRRRRRLVIAGIAAAVVGALAALAADVVLEYVPAVRAVLRARTDLEQAEALLRNDTGHLDTARLARATSLLQAANTELGPASAALESGLLARIADQVPWVRRQVDAVRALRTTALDADRLGLDLVPIVGDLLPRSGDDRTTLARLATAARDQKAAIARLPGDVAELDAALRTLPGGGLLGSLDQARTVAQRDVPAIADAVRSAIPFLEAVPAAVGQGRHTYLILVANPGEERPGGGFIGAVGEVDVSNGEVTGRSFRDSAFADGLVRDIPAPRPLDDYLFQGRPWSLSDANWSPDFPTSAAQVATFYERATGVHPDGEIEVDPVAFSYLLSVLGPVQVPPYAQTVTAANALHELNDITNKARPGDPGKVFLPPFGQTVLDRVLHAPITEVPQLLGGLRAAVGEKHLVLHFDDPTLQAVVDADHAGGEVEAPLSDSVLVADANVGAGKGDLFTTRRYELTANVDDLGGVVDHLVLTYTDPVLQDPADRSLVAQSQGRYRDYVRVYLPEPAHLDGLSLSSDGGAARKVTPEETSYDLNRLVVAFLVEVAPGHSVSLALDYDGGFADITTTPIGYTLGWEKQVGALPWPVTVTVHLPSGVTRSWSATLDGDLRLTTVPARS